MIIWSPGAKQYKFWLILVSSTHSTDINITWLGHLFLGQQGQQRYNGHHGNHGHHGQHDHQGY